MNKTPEDILTSHTATHVGCGLENKIRESDRSSAGDSYKIGKNMGTNTTNIGVSRTMLGGPTAYVQVDPHTPDPPPPERQPVDAEPEVEEPVPAEEEGLPEVHTHHGPSSPTHPLRSGDNSYDSATPGVVP